MRVIRSSLGRNAPTRAGRSLVVEARASGKRVLITGGNTGIGYQTALSLAQKDFEVVLACRDMAKAASAETQIRSAVPGASISSVKLDLGNLASVRDCANGLLDQGKPFDVVLNNAGVMNTPPMKTDDGFEFQLGINHLGHFLLTQMLLPQLLEAGKPARIINVASSAHQFGSINFDDLMREKSYNSWEAYGQSKLANVLYSYELARRLTAHPQITVNALHPGVVNTELGRYTFGGLGPLLEPLVLAAAGAFLKTPAQGAETSIYLASSPDAANISSKYYSDCKPITTSPASYDAAVASRLFDVSVELTNPPSETTIPAAVSAVSAGV